MLTAHKVSVIAALTSLAEMEKYQTHNICHIDFAGCLQNLNFTTARDDIAGRNTILTRYNSKV